ncbi:unnamed protein product, partial [Choristocarpus tenellus]
MVTRSNEYIAKSTMMYNLQLFNVNKKLLHIALQVDMYKRITLLISKEDIPGLKHIFAQALQSSCGKVLDKVAQAMQGTYLARGYESKCHNVSLVVLKIGGPSLLMFFNRA